MKMKSLFVILLLAVFLVSGCGSPTIDIQESTGFTHKTSAKVPFTGESAGSLFINDQGTASLFFHGEKFYGNVNPEKDYSPVLYGVSRGGSAFRNDYGTFQQIQMEREGRFFYGADDTDFITKATFNELGSGAWFNEQLAGMLRGVPSMTMLDHVITYDLGLSSQIGIERWLAIYDIDTGEEAQVDLGENYISIDTLDVMDDNVLVKATKADSETPDFYILGTDGEIRLKVTPMLCDEAHRCNACFIQDGIIIYCPYHIRESSLTKYNWDGSPVWAHVLPIQGIPELQVQTTQDDEIITLSAWDDDARYIEYSSASNGTVLFSRSFHTESFISLTDIPGRYYVCPQWSGYPEMEPPTGRISLYRDDTEIAYIEIEDGIYYFKTSPDGGYFAVVTDKTLSVFSLDDNGG